MPSDANVRSGDLIGDFLGCPFDEELPAINSSDKLSDNELADDKETRAHGSFTKSMNGKRNKGSPTTEMCDSVVNCVAVILKPVPHIIKVKSTI